MSVGNIVSMLEKNVVPWFPFFGVFGSSRSNNSWDGKLSKVSSDVINLELIFLRMIRPNSACTTTSPGNP